MIQSMTGYAARKREIFGGTLHVELRSVNSRYLDCLFRVADELRASEPALRELLAARVLRGKVECRVHFVADAASGQQARLNGALLARLVAWEGEIRHALPQAAPLTVSDVLRWPGMLAEPAIAGDALVAACLELASEAMVDFVASRTREGEKLAAVILERVACMRVLLASVQQKIPAAQAAFNEKLNQRLAEALAVANDERIRQEVAVFAARIDIAEELARLSTHLDEVERVMQAGGACGKRLDFLMQELNREANTLGSKSLASDVSQTAIDFKLLIEQMREQVQNLV